MQGWGKSTKEGLQVHEPASQGPGHQLHPCAWILIRSSEIPARKGVHPEGFWHQGAWQTGFTASKIISASISFKTLIGFCTNPVISPHQSFNFLCSGVFASRFLYVANCQFCLAAPCWRLEAGAVHSAFLRNDFSLDANIFLDPQTSLGPSILSDTLVDEINRSAGIHGSLLTRHDIVSLPRANWWCSWH